MNTRWTKVPKHPGWYRESSTQAPWKSVKRFDPYFIWAAATEFADVGGPPALGAWIPITIELRKETAKKFAAEMAKPRHEWIRIDTLYSNPPAALVDATFCTAIVKAVFFEKLATDGYLKKVVERFELGLALASESIVNKEPQTYQPSENPHEKPTRVSCVVGIIDDGIAFAHERFRETVAKPRVDYFWDQGLYSKSISDTRYGHELTNGEIKDYMAKSKSPAGSVDEDTVYRLANYNEVRRRIAHGTFVLDVACGLEIDRFGKELPPRIVAVQLQAPSRRTRDRASGWLTARVLDGLRYILDRATKIKSGQIPPVVINLSFGLTAGPHNGSSVLEKAIDQLIELGRRKKGIPLEVVIAAGNSNLKRCHARFSLRANGKNSEKILCWRALPDDPTPNFLEIWLPKLKSPGSKPDVQVVIKSPLGNRSPTISIGSTYKWQPGASALCTVTSNETVATGDRTLILIALAPSASMDSNREVAPSGVWEITIHNTSGEKLDDIHAWIQRDETPYTFPAYGRQSRFDDPNYQIFDDYGYAKDDDPPAAARDKAYVKRFGTINSIATGEGTTVVGGYRRSDGAAARYSSSGPKLSSSGGTSNDLAPTALAVSDDSVVCHGILASGSRSSCVLAIDGTSVAAPQVTRWMWQQMVNGSYARNGKDAVRVLAITQDPSAQGKPVPERGGHGRIEFPSIHLR